MVLGTGELMRLHFKVFWRKIKLKPKIKHLKYETFQIRRYLSESQCAKIAKVIFNI